MKREVLTTILERSQIDEELSFMVKYFSKKGIRTCKILFGFSWGLEYYPGKEWNDEEIQLANLSSKVQEVEKSGIGKLGRDDLFVKFPELEFRFCNDSDVHITFSETNDDIEYYYVRWKQLGYQPSEWLKNQKHGPGERVRFN